MPYEEEDTWWQAPHYIYMCVRVCVCVCVRVRVRVCACVRVHIYKYKYKYICVYIYRYTYRLRVAEGVEFRVIRGRARCFQRRSQGNRMCSLYKCVLYQGHQRKVTMLPTSFARP